MSDIEIDITKWDGNWPAAGKATAHALRVGVGGPPDISRVEQIVAMLRLASQICTKTADKLEIEDNPEFTVHLRIPSDSAEWREI